MRDVCKRVREFCNKPYALPVFLVMCGIIGGAALAHFLPWPCILVGPLALYSLVYTQALRLRYIFLLGWLGGFALIGTAIYWMFNSYPLDWAGVSDPIQGFIITAITWFVIAATLSFFIGVWALVAHLCIRRTATDVFFIPVSWVLFEWVRMWGFTFITWGPGSVLVPYFSFGMIGYALARSSAFLHVAEIGGAYLLSGVAIFLGFLVWLLVVHQEEILKRRLLYILIALSVVTYGILAVIPFSRTPPLLNIATMEMDAPATLQVSAKQNDMNIQTIKSKLARLAHAQPIPDVIIIPEDMRFLPTLVEKGEDPQKYLQSLFGSHEVLVIDSGRVDTYLGAYARVSYFSSLHGEIATRGKYIVIPFGEFIPYLMQAGLRTFGMQDALARDEANRNYLAGTVPSAVEYHGATLVALLCSEMLSPSLYHDTAQGTKNPIFINLSSQSDFHHGRNPFLELYDMMVIQSAWGNAPYFQSSNGVPEVRIAR